MMMMMMVPSSEGDETNSISNKSKNRCSVHDEYTEWQRERWEDQKAINQQLFSMNQELSEAITNLKTRISYLGGIMAALVFVSPFLWKLIFQAIGVKFNG